MVRASTKTSEGDAMDAALKQVVPTEIEDMPLTCLRDYRLYNEAASAANKRLKVCRYPLKPCPVELHPTERIVFGRVDQPSNPLKVFKSDSVIHFEKTLIPGQTYDLPRYIVNYLAEKGNPIWKWVDLPNGERETVVSHKEPRFTLRTIHQD